MTETATQVVDPAAMESPGRAPKRRGPWPNGAVATAAHATTLVVILALWECAVRLGVVSPSLAYGPLDVARAVPELVSEGALAANLWATLKATLIALVLAAMIGTPIGLMLALLPRTESVLSPYMSALNAMPRVALAPVFVITFGIDASAKIALAFTLAVFVFIINARAGVLSADDDVLRLTAVLRATKTQQFFKVLLPVATPSIFAGARLALIYSLLGVVTSEIIASRDGVGLLIAQYSAAFQLDRVYALLIVLALASAVLNTVTGALEKRLMRWQRTS